MRDLPELDERTFYEFVAQPVPSLLFVFVHPLHPFNAALLQRLPEAFGGRELPMAALSLTELVLSRSPVLAFLQQATHELRVGRRFGVLPGYYLTHGGRFLAWQSGLPAGKERSLLLGSAIFGAMWHAATGHGAAVARLVQSMFDETSAVRIAASFERAFARGGEAGHAPGPRVQVTPQELRWAYRRLGLAPSASDREVERAWRKLRAANHPDLAQGDPAEVERRTRISLELDRARELIRARRAQSATHHGN